MNMATHLIDIFALCYLCGVLRNSTMIKSNRKKPFAIAIFLAVIAVLSEVGTFLAEGQAGLRSLHVACNVIGFSLTPMIPLALIAIFDTKLLRKRKWLLLPTVVNLALTVSSLFNGMIFMIDASNRYFRGSHYSIFVAVYGINLLFLLVYTLYITQKYRYPIIGKVSALLVFTVVCTSIQLVNPAACSTWHCVTISLILYFLLMSDFDCSFDPLSGLYNRYTFDKAVKQMTHKGSLSIVVLDINDFKNINDTYGHFYGDIVIKEVAATIRESFDRCCQCYRIGGDEFAVICDETDHAIIELQLEKMNHALAQKRKLDQRIPSVAYGYSIYRQGEDSDFGKTFHDADAKMYQSKKLHRARTVRSHD
jgi:diguanylate cyclase (GGDEF)-like protein